MSRAHRPVSDDEARLFNDSMHDAKPLKRRARAAPRQIVPEPKLEPTEKPAVPLKRPAPPTVPARPLPPLDHRAAPSIDKRTQERFRRGEMAVDATLDLHGMTQEAAHGALNRFVQHAAASGHRCLLIVTGKGLREGTGVLRAQVPRWLNEAELRPYLLALSHARPRHGGEGALYVLLKRKR